MSSLFTRTIPAKIYKDYSKYKPNLRSDFKKCCAYCLIHEDYLGGETNFEIDHHQPSSLFPSLNSTYTNLFWSCHTCNNAKSNKWPTPQDILQGKRFIDTTQEKYSDHFTIDDKGRIYSTTDIGLYTRFILKLDRPGLVKSRLLILGLAAQACIEVDWDQPVDDIVGLIAPWVV